MFALKAIIVSAAIASALSSTLKQIKQTATPTLSPTTSGTVPPTTVTAPTSSPTYTGATVPHWGQCDGINWTGPTVCAAPYTCEAANAYHWQCL